MKTWKIVALVAGAIIALVAMIIGGVFYATSGVTDTADKFFESAEKGDYPSAYALMSKSIQQDNTLEDITAYIKHNHLDTVVDTSWSSRSINNNLGKLTGTLETRNGGAIPIVIDLVGEGEDWKINLMEVQQSGLKTTGTATKKDTSGAVPSAAITTNLIRFHTGRWADAVERNDYEYFAQFWVDGVKPTDLQNAYSKIDLDADELKALKNARPVVKNVALDKKGVLFVEAEFRSKTRSLRTKYKFVPKTGKPDDWDILSLDVYQHEI